MIALFFFIAMKNFLGMVTISIPGYGNLSSPTPPLCRYGRAGLWFDDFVTGLGLYKHGLKFFTLFVPEVPLPLLFVLVPIEVISYLTRPVTLAVRCCQYGGGACPAQPWRAFPIS